MTPARRLLALLFLAAGLAACAPYDPVPVDPMAAPWNAALAAVEDAGLRVVAADRATGTIRGTRGAAEGTVSVRMRSDGRVGVEINSRGDPGLTQRITDAYNRRMGR